MFCQVFRPSLYNHVPIDWVILGIVEFRKSEAKGRSSFPFPLLIAHIMQQYGTRLNENWQSILQENVAWPVDLTKSYYVLSKIFHFTFLILRYFLKLFFDLWPNNLAHPDWIRAGQVFVNYCIRFTLKQSIVVKFILENRQFAKCYKRLWLDKTMKF